MKRLFLLFALFIMLPAAALADDSKGDGDKVIDNEALANVRAVVQNYVSHLGRPIDHGSCLIQMDLKNFSVAFDLPSKTPDAYLVRWTARRNGSFRAVDKPNTKRAGNLTIKHSEIAQSGGGGSIDAGAIHVPAGQRIKVKIRAIYGKSKGPKSQFSFNTDAWIHVNWGDQDAACW